MKPERKWRRKKIDMSFLIVLPMHSSTKQQFNIRGGPIRRDSYKTKEKYVANASDGLEKGQTVANFQLHLGENTWATFDWIMISLASKQSQMKEALIGEEEKQQFDSLSTPQSTQKLTGNCGTTWKRKRQKLISGEPMFYHTPQTLIHT